MDKVYVVESFSTYLNEEVIEMVTRDEQKAFDKKDDLEKKGHEVVVHGPYAIE